MTTQRIFGNYVNQDRYLYELRSAYAGLRLQIPDVALQKDPYAWDKMLRDPTIRAGISGRARAAAGSEWTVEPPKNPTEDEKRLAAMVDRGLSELGDRKTILKRMADEVLKGQAFEWIRGERELRKLDDDDTERWWWIPKGLRQMDMRRIRYIPKRNPDGSIDEFDDRIAQYASKSWISIDAPSNAIAEWADADGWNDLDMRNVACVTYDDSEARLGRGRGLADALYFSYYNKVRLVEYSQNWAERWGEGQVYAKVDTNSLNVTGTGTDDLRMGWLDVIDKMRARFGLVFDRDDEVGVLDPGSIGPEKLVVLLEYHDNWMTRVIRGALLPSGSAETVGSNARAETEEGSEDTVTQFDRAAIDDGMTRGPVHQFIRINAALFREAGINLKSSRYPRFRTSSKQRPEFTEATTRAVQLHGMGIDLAKDDVYEQTGFREPNEQDLASGNVIEGREEMADDGMGGDGAAAQDPFKPKAGAGNGRSGGPSSRFFG